jgi:hypothetical protein
MSTLLEVDLLDRYGQVVTTLECTQGSSVTDDRSQANRRSCDLSIVDPTGALSPANRASYFAPGTTSGFRVQARTRPSPTWPGGMPLGTFVCQTGKVTDSGDNRQVQVTGMDRSWLVTAYPVGATGWAVQPGTPWSDAFAEVIQFYAPTLDLSGFTDVTWPTPPLMLNPGSEPWTEMATTWGPAVGVELWVSPDDKGYLTFVPDPRDQNAMMTSVFYADWEFIEGDGCHMTQVEHSFTDDSCPNGWQRDGLGPAQNLVTATVWDENPNSSSYAGPRKPLGQMGYLSPNQAYGQRLNYSQDTLIASQPQCTSAAQCQFNLGIGQNEPVTITLDPTVYNDPSGNWGIPVAGQMGVVRRHKAGLDDAWVTFDTIHHGFFPGDTVTITGRRIWMWA